MDDPFVKSQDMLDIRFEWMNKYHLNMQLTKEINTKCKFILKFQSDTSTMSSLGFTSKRILLNFQQKIDFILLFCVDVPSIAH